MSEKREIKSILKTNTLDPSISNFNKLILAQEIQKDKQHIQDESTIKLHNFQVGQSIENHQQQPSQQQARFQSQPPDHSFAQSNLVPYLKGDQSSLIHP